MTNAQSTPDLRVIHEQRGWFVLDNTESLLGIPKMYVAGPFATSPDAHAALRTILNMAVRP